MSEPHPPRLFNLRRLSRRTLLRAGAVCIGLPLLEAMLPIGAQAASRTARLLPRRLLLIGRGLGVHGDHFFPAETGLNYTATRSLSLLEKHRGRFTVFSGLSHPGYPNSHHTEAGLFTGVDAQRIERFEHIRNTVSLDQLVAEHWAEFTRIPSLVMGGVVTTPMSYDPQGVAVPSELRPAEVFKQLFVNGNPDAVRREIRRLEDGSSILDEVKDQLRRLGKQVGAADRDRLDRMATTLRSAETELRRTQSWASKPKPIVDRTVSDYSNPGWSSGQRMRYDLAFLAFQTDVTRVAISTETVGAPGDAAGSMLGQHDASHHGKDPQKIEQFALFSDEETRNVARLLNDLSSATEGDASLLDRTVVLWASNLGNPSAHSSNNLPVLLAGGGFAHRGHVRWPEQAAKPLSNLYSRILTQLELAQDRFGSSTGMLEW